jgi:AAA15 family ATPase/GTPase
LQFFDPAVEDVEVWAKSGVRPQLYIRHQDSGLAPLSAFGDGMRRILLMATTLPLCKDGILLIDELETAIHTRVLDKTLSWLVQACEQYNIQLFATTHSLETLDALLDMSQQNGVEMVTYRIEATAQQTRVTMFDQEFLTRFREDFGREVRW